MIKDAMMTTILTFKPLNIPKQMPVFFTRVREKYLNTLNEENSPDKRRSIRDFDSRSSAIAESAVQ